VLGAVRAFRETTGPAQTRAADGLGRAPHLRNRGAQTLGSLLTFLAISLVALHIAATSASITAPQPSFRGQEESPMHRLGSVAAVTTTVIATLATASSAFAQDAVEWRVADGGNGHWYQLRIAYDAVSISWHEALADANASGGYLATVPTAAENQFVFQYTSIPGWSCAADCYGPWLGGYQDTQSPAFQEPAGGWKWITGEPWSYSNWGCTLPNNAAPQQDFLHYHTYPQCAPVVSPKWDDLNAEFGYFKSYIVEWSADCNNDGLIDFGQIRAGELADSNANNIPDCCESSVACDNCPADIDESGTVNGVDLAALLSVWGSDGAKYPRADIDGSGEVNAADLAAVLNSWGACP
jgi:hypothetical protein